MVTLFSPSESLYDRYSAALAATEPLRSSLPTAALKNIPYLSRVFLTTDICSAKNCDRFPSISATCQNHVVKSSKIIRSLGLTVAQFNDVSRKIAKDDELKARIMEQAYLYRVSSKLSLDKVPLIEDPTSLKLLSLARKRRLQNFAHTLDEIEDLRDSQTTALKRSLNVRSLPNNLRVCDPNILPFLSPKIQQVCDAFPLLAEDIVRKYGLNSEEFNKMLEETRKNPVLRWRVNRYMKKIGQKGKRSNSSGGHQL
ncbi:hypothetical protein TrLO_g11440 [Triparma laevis f. longispina]|nr:hypothetical protein TrLO_g11440 [Triparma laevis f. longispina]